MKIIDRLFTTLALNKIIHHAGVQWARPIEGQHRNDVFETVGLQFGEQLFHAVRFHLKNGGGIGIAQHLIGGRIIKTIEFPQGQLAIRIEPIDVIHGQLDNGQVA